MTLVKMTLTGAAVLCSALGLLGAGNATAANVEPAASFAQVRNAYIPGLCGHPAGSLVAGQRNFGYGDRPGLPPGGPRGEDRIGQISLHRYGTADAAAVIRCNAGGVSWPDTVVFFRNGRWTSYRTLKKAGMEHSYVSSIAADGNALRVIWITYDGCCFYRQTHRGRLWNTPRPATLTNIINGPITNPRPPINWND